MVIFSPLSVFLSLQTFQVHHRLSLGYSKLLDNRFPLHNLNLQFHFVLRTLDKQPENKEEQYDF
jgi:hypothetical protein